MFSVRLILFAIAVICAVNGISADQYRIIGTINGEVRGIKKSTLLRGVPFYSFKGIPYAKPPVDELRFKAPEPVGSWKPTILDAFEHSNVCMNPGIFMNDSFTRSEDCLTLNIYTPADVNPDEKWAVLFFIHGGGYAEGSSNDLFYGPDFIVEKDTILVTMNYRLGFLGFLSLNSPEYSGNMGLKDQQLALKWVSSNIERFGGDKNRITIGGQSAGGASTHFHIMSAESRKYYKNAIPMSGTVENYWAMSEHNDHVELAYQIAENLGQPKKNIEELINFLKSLPAEKFNEFSQITARGILFEIPFTPVIERKDATQPFIVETPEDIYKTAKIDTDVLFTVASSELVGMLEFVPSLQEFSRNFNLQLPFRGLKALSNTDEYRNLIKKVRKFYFGNGPINETALQAYVDLLSDMNFLYGIEKSAKSHALKVNGKTFYYRFSVDSKLNMFKRENSESAQLPGASHADDLFYLFRAHMADSVYDEVLSTKTDKDSEISLRAIEHISTIVTNFAKFGTPLLKNDPIRFNPINTKSQDISYLDINNDGLTVGLNPHQEIMKFWNEIEQKVEHLRNNQRDEL